MKNMTLGTWVQVNRVSTVEYEEKTKGVCKYPCEPFKAVVVGQVIKRLGKYIPQRGGASFGNIEDYEQAQLHVTGTVTLWEVKATMTGKIILVDDDDLTEIGPFNVPRAGFKPTYINPFDDTTRETDSAPSRASLL
jgi:hypothetical protein